MLFIRLFFHLTDIANCLALLHIPYLLREVPLIYFEAKDHPRISQPASVFEKVQLFKIIVQYTTVAVTKDAFTHLR